ncbi:protein spire homolog 2 isoform X2 [Engraulis encrasicolus]|uniref:protein spire homolog 2 isoform X2 n=1 Tax=Engraulis encrasicolus TaxID=184585 RepID=UPI002FCE6A18
MESFLRGPNSTHLLLKEILELREHAVTEEQAWALCYKLCTLLEGCWNGNVHSNDTPKNPSLPGEDGIVISSDGDVCFQGEFVFSSQNKVVARLGRLIYHCLDWGIDVDSERELSDALAHLLCRMMKIPCSGAVRRSICTLHEAIQTCAARVGGEEQAAHHYKAVIASLFSEAIELYDCIQSIKSTSKGLQVLCQSDSSGSCQDDPDKVFAWRHVVQELQTGVNLKPCQTTVPPRPHRTPEEQFPFEKLNQDIKCKRYSLIKSEARGGQPLQRTEGHHCLFEAIRSRPKLRPVSERKLRPKPVEEPCLHERLMTQIRTTDPKLLFSLSKRRVAQRKVDFRQVSSHSIKTLDCQVGTPHALPLSSTAIKCSKEPISWVQISSSHRVEGRKRRIQSFGSYSAIKHSKGCDVANVGVTIKMVMMKAHQAKMSSSKWQVCSCCFKQSHFFTWHNSCSRCYRVVCPHCCVKMQVPNKWCMELPISFFRLIVLRAGGDHSHFWKERLSWDYTKVPMVLEPQVVGSCCQQHSLAMRGWHCQDICTECQAILEKACHSSSPQSHATGSLEI